MRVGCEMGECPFFGGLGDGHFGHIRFKKFLILYFGGHKVECKAFLGLNSILDLGLEDA